MLSEKPKKVSEKGLMIALIIMVVLTWIINFGASLIFELPNDRLRGPAWQWYSVIETLLLLFFYVGRVSQKEITSNA